MKVLFLLIFMRYHYEKPNLYSTYYGRTYHCDHPVYDVCTLYEFENRGLALIQQRFDKETKTTWWSEIDPWLVDAIYLQPNFKQFFEERSGEGKDGIFPTATVRQAMWALKMKPIKRERWETCFDKRDI